MAAFLGDYWGFQGVGGLVGVVGGFVHFLLLLASLFCSLLYYSMSLMKVKSFWEFFCGLVRILAGERYGSYGR